MSLSRFFKALSTVFSAETPIEAQAIKALLAADADVDFPLSSHALGQTPPLADAFLEVMAQPDAHPICQDIAAMPFQWAPPETSQDPLYKQHSDFKAHVELLGPYGLVPSSDIRLGLYGILPHSEYGIRTHPAEETFIMLAGRASWKHDTADYISLGSGQRSYHPSMMPHATRTEDNAFMSVYIWHGDIATDNYQYYGLPNA